MNKDVTRQWANVIATVVTIVINILANALPIGGRTTGEVSDSFAVYFVPAGYVFSIWGIIYLGVGLFAIYQALPAQRENPLLRRLGYWYVAASVANSIWIFMWHNLLFGWTMVFMVALLVSLIGAYLSLGIGRYVVRKIERWIVYLPFSIYLGWITVATVANATNALDFYGWGGWGVSPELWAAIMLVVATAVGVLMSVTRGDIAFTGVLVWAFVGIAVKFPDTLLVSITAAVMAALAIVALIWAYPKAKAKRVPFPY